MSPAVGGNRLVIRLNSVVLPAPFGPINAVRLPSGTSNETSETAVSPPNRLLTLTIFNAAVLIGGHPSTAQVRAAAARGGRRAATPSRRAIRKFPRADTGTPAPEARPRRGACTARTVERFPARASAAPPRPASRPACLRHRSPAW